MRIKKTDCPIYSHGLFVTFEQIQDVRRRRHDRLSSSFRQFKDSQDSNVMTDKDWGPSSILVYCWTTLYLTSNCSYKILYIPSKRFEDSVYLLTIRFFSWKDFFTFCFCRCLLLRVVVVFSCTYSSYEPVLNQDHISIKIK